MKFINALSISLRNEFIICPNMQLEKLQKNGKIFPNLYRPKNFSWKFYLGEQLRIVQTQAILFFKSVSERDGSDME